MNMNKNEEILRNITYSIACLEMKSEDERTDKEKEALEIFKKQRDTYLKELDVE